jgi:hypothetical protein
MSKDDVYLGDGLYASFDGQGVKLWTPRMDGEHWVYLEDHVMHAFLAMVGKLASDHPEMQERWGLRPRSA